MNKVLVIHLTKSGHRNDQNKPKEKLPEKNAFLKLES